jgi:hypothetical protein
MPDARKRPCRICRRWFRPDPRIGSRQQACRRPECQAARRKKKQKSWRERNPDYFIARRIKDRSGQDRPPEPLRLPPPLSRLPWDIAQSQFGTEGADFIGIMGAVLLRSTQSQFRAYVTEDSRLADTLPSGSTQSQMRPVQEWIAVEGKPNEVGVSPTRPPL